MEHQAKMGQRIKFDVLTKVVMNSHVNATDVIYYWPRSFRVMVFLDEYKESSPRRKP